MHSQVTPVYIHRADVPPGRILPRHRHPSWRAQLMDIPHALAPRPRLCASPAP